MFDVDSCIRWLTNIIDLPKERAEILCAHEYILSIYIYIYLSFILSMYVCMPIKLVLSEFYRVFAQPFNIYIYIYIT